MNESFGKSLKSSSFYSPLGKNIGKGYAHSKIILMGEHSVVYNYPAIALPYGAIQVNCIVRPNFFPKTTIDCKYYQGMLDEAPDHLANIQKAYYLTLQTLQVDPQPVHIEIHSQIPEERGMGSSAAVVVSLIRSLSDFYQKSLSQYQLHLITNEAEVIAHQSTSGIDTLVASSDDPIIYRKSHAAKTFKIDLDAYLIVADSGQVGRTRLAVSHVKEVKNKKPHYVDQVMSTIGRFVNQAYDAIQGKNIIELGRLMTYNHYYLNQLGVSSQDLDRIVNSAWLAGALGAKLTGGGLGGCVIALADNKDQAQLIAQAMLDAGAQKTWELSLSANSNH